MDKKLIKKLASASYTKNLLDEVKVNKIAKELNRKELKLYVLALKNIERANTVYAYFPYFPGKDDIKNLKRLYPDKKLVAKTDKSLIAGVRIVNNDIIYENNIKNNLNKIISLISE
ncbi:hypothetical protein M1615_03685 [Patescibacteria group bacterium]|nr:hypothetical protein [Patescibacteria group bacterium]